MSAVNELRDMLDRNLEDHEYEHTDWQAILELAERVKALEDRNVVRVYDVEEPVPAPDLDALVDKYFGQFTKATFDLDVPVMQAFKYVLSAFAEELRMK